MSSYKGRIVLPKRDGEYRWYTRGYLPHFDGERVTQHVCFGLFDSLPQQRLRFWSEELKQLTAKQADIERRKRIEQYLDNGYGSCFLKDARAAQILRDAMLHFDGERYALHAWCVMPNHVHVLFTPALGFRTSEIVQTWKSFTANRCNKLLGRTGSFWQKESFDRYIRNDRHYWNALRYIENNPVKAGLCQRPEDWRWSSAGCARFQRAQ